MKKLLFLFLLFPTFLFSQTKIVLKGTQVTISSLANIAGLSVVANAAGSPATPTAVLLGVGLTFSNGKLAIDTANFKDSIYALNGLSILGVGFNRIGLGGFLSQNTTISGSNLYALTLDSMQAATGRGFRVNFGSDAGWDIPVRDSATGFWTRIPKGTVGQSLQMLGSGGVGWGNQSGGAGVGNNYFVSPTGLSTGQGSSPATAITFARLITLSSSFVGGEKIYFQANGTYYGDLTIQSGTYVGEYGGGGANNRPKIRGTILSNTLTWTQNGSVWSATMPTRITRLFRNAAPERCAQSASYYTITTKASSTSITSTGATGLGAWAAHSEIVGKEYDFRWFWDTTSAYNSGTGNFTLTYGNASVVNEQFKLINNENLIAADGDWAWRAGTIYYRSPGNVNPNTLSVELAFYNEGILIPNGAANITIENLSFFGQAYDGIYADTVNSISISNCDFKSQFNAGVTLMGRVEKANLYNLQVDSTAANGLITMALLDSRVTNCLMTNIAMGTDPPICRSSNAGGPGDRYLFPINKTLGNAFQSDPNSFRDIFEYDTAINLAYCGLFLNGASNSVVKNCVVHDFCRRQNDGGAIYCYADSIFYNSLYGWLNIYNFQVINNLVYNGYGTNEAGISEPNLAFGIYFDDGTYAAKAIGNTVSNCGIGIVANFNGQQRSIRGNTCYNNVEQLRIANWPVANGGPGPVTTRDTVENNIFVSLTASQYCIDFYDYAPGGFIETNASFINNTFISPYTNNIIAKTINNGGGVTNYTLAGATGYYGYTFGQQDPYSTAFVNIATSLANVPIDINNSLGSRTSNVPLNFHNPMGKNVDQILGPYMSAVYITGAFSGASGWTPASNDVYETNLGKVEVGSTTIGARKININDANPYLGLTISDVEKGIIGISSGAGVGIPLSVANDMIIRGVSNIDFSVDAGATLFGQMSSTGFGVGRLPTAKGDFFTQAASNQVISQSNFSTGYGFFSATNDASQSVQFLAAGSALVTAGLNQAHYGILQFNGTTAGLIQTVGATAQPIIFGINTSGGVTSEVGRLAATTGHLLLNTTTDNGQLTVAGVIAPEATGTRDLGTSSFKFRNEFLSGDANLTGAQFRNVTLVSATGSYTVLATDYEVIFTGSTATVVYPAATTNRVLILLNQASGTVTLPTTTNGNGTTTTSLTTGQMAIEVYDGTVWRAKIF